MKSANGISANCAERASDKLPSRNKAVASAVFTPLASRIADLFSDKGKLLPKRRKGLSFSD